MKRLLIAVLIVLFIAPVVFAGEFKFVTVSDLHITGTIKRLKSDATLNVLILGYNKDIKYQDIPVLADSVKAVRKSYLRAGIDKSKTVLGFALGEGELWKKYNFKKDGVYVKLFRD